MTPRILVVDDTDGNRYAVSRLLRAAEMEVMEAASGHEALRLIVWHGMLPATLGMLWGVLLRQWLGTKVFVYLFGRCFMGTVFSLFAASMLASATGQPLPGVNEDLSHIAHWLMAWGDAVVTGMICSVCVAYRPDWLATWSDRLYLYEQVAEKHDRSA